MAKKNDAPTSNETVCSKCTGVIQTSDPRYCRKCMDFADARLDDLRKENARKGKIIEDLVAQGEKANLKLSILKV
jgi:hypothetical protein